MAIRHLSVKVGKVGKASAHMSYIVRDGKYARQRGDDLEHVGHGNMPSWAASNPARFWAAADEFERANGSAYREIEVALPRELKPDDAHQLAQRFIREHLGAKYPYSYAIHSPIAADGERQPHMHLMFSERALDGIDRGQMQYFKRANRKSPEKGGAAKTYNPAATPTERRAALKALRAEWAEMATQALAEAGHSRVVDLRSNADQGIEAVPEPKHSPGQWRKGGREAMVAARARVEAARAALMDANELHYAAIVARLEVEEVYERAEAAQRAAEERQRQDAIQRAAEAARQAPERRREPQSLQVALGAVQREASQQQDEVKAAAPRPGIGDQIRALAAQSMAEAAAAQRAAEERQAQEATQQAAADARWTPTEREKPLIAAAWLLETRGERTPAKDKLLQAVWAALGDVARIVCQMFDGMTRQKSHPDVQKNIRMIEAWVLTTEQLVQQLRAEGHLPPAPKSTPEKPAQSKIPPRKRDTGWER